MRFVAMAISILMREYTYLWTDRDVSHGGI